MSKPIKQGEEDASRGVRLLDSTPSWRKASTWGSEQQQRTLLTRDMTPHSTEGQNLYTKKGDKPVMITDIERIAIKARNSKKESFTSIAHFITPKRLEDNLKKIPKQTGVGIDEQSVQEARKEFPIWSEEIIRKIHTKGYKPPPVRRAYIPKIGKKEKRPIGVPTVADRVLQKSTAEVLNAIYEEDFLDCSFGGRPKRSAHQALATLNRVITGKKVNWIYEADLKNFFGSLDHKWVLRFIEERVKDPRILTLIRRWLKAGVMEKKEYQHTHDGVPQGGPISVLISNIYLHYALDLWIEKAMRKKMQGQMYYIRYLDDFLVCFQYQADAILFQEEIEYRLKKFSLSLEHSKTRLIEFGRFAQENARKKGKRAQTLYFLGFTIYCSKARKGTFKIVAKTEKLRLNRAHKKIKELLKRVRHFAIKEQVKAINAVIRGLYQYYGIWGNVKALYQIYQYTRKCWKKTLSSRSQRGRITWGTYGKILEAYPLRRPKLVMPYTKIGQYAIL